MQEFLVTNNPMVYEKFAGQVEIEFMEDKSFLDVLYFVRDKVHLGHKLLTHPLSGSVKPDETPYKSVMITSAVGAFDMDSLRIIEGCIAVAKELYENRKRVITPEKLLKDFQLVDLALISGKN